jgi:large subunit ribosomal protein L11
LLKKAAGLDKGSDNALKNKVGSISEDKLREIAALKQPDLNAKDIDGAMKILAGTARSMGIEVK